MNDFGIEAGRSWFGPYSAIRRAAREVCNLPRRIAANRELPNWAIYRLPPTPRGLPPNRFRQSCSEGIATLRKECPWAGDLDAQILAKAYAAGCAWAFDNFGTGKSKESAIDPTKLKGPSDVLEGPFPR